MVYQPDGYDIIYLLESPLHLPSLEYLANQHNFPVDQPNTAAPAQIYHGIKRQAFFATSLPSQPKIFADAFRRVSIPLGLVEQHGSGKSLQFSISNDAREMAKMVIAHLAVTQDELHHNLSDCFYGGSPGQKRQQPRNTVLAYEALTQLESSSSMTKVMDATNQKIRNGDDSIDINNIARIINILDKAGLVNQDKSVYHQDSEYKMTDTHKIKEIVEDKDKIPAPNQLEMLLQQPPQDWHSIPFWQEKFGYNAPTNAAKLLKEWSELGIMRHQGKSGAKKSDIHLTEFGRMVFQRVLAPLMGSYGAFVCDHEPGRFETVHGMDRSLKLFDTNGVKYKAALTSLVHRKS